MTNFGVHRVKNQTEPKRGGKTLGEKKIKRGKGKLKKHKGGRKRKCDH